MSSTTILPWGGGELSSLDPLSTAGCIEQTSGSGTDYDPAYARCAIHISPGYYGTSPTWPAASTFWFHGALNGGAYLGSVTNARTASFYQSGMEVLRFVSTYSGSLNIATWQIFTLQGGSLTFVGQTNIPAGSSPNTFDIKLVAGASGQVQLYSSGSLVINSPTNLPHTGFGGVDQVQITGIGVPFNGSDAFWSEVICDSQSHIGDRLRTYPIDTLSAVNNGWVGGVGNVNEIVLNDANFVSANNPNLIDTFYANGFSLGTLNIVAVLVCIRINCGSSGPQNVQLAIRTGGNNFFSPTVACSNGFQATTYPWTTNPNTSTQWLAADAQALEGGMKSIA